MDWTQALTIIISILIPTIACFGWIIHRMDQKFEKIDHELQDIKTRLTVLERVMGIFSGNLKITRQERTDP